MVVAAFEACFLPNGSSWRGVPPGDPWFLQRSTPLHLGEKPKPWMVAIDADPELAAPPHNPDRYVTLSGPWTRRLETWCRMYDRRAREPGAGIRSLIEDIATWHPTDGAPLSRDRGRSSIDPGAPLGPAFFVARLGRRAKLSRCGTDTPKARRRRLNVIDWSEGDRW
jgi:hypothetical protein